MRWKVIITVLIILLSGLGYYQLTGNTAYSAQEVNVTRVIDGDTIVVGDNEHVRMLGINTPEKNEPFHDEAMNYMKQLIEGKQVELERVGKDKYKRTLGYIYLNNELINKKQLEEGFANLYYYGTDHNYEEMKKTEETARLNEEGLWKKSPNSDCVKLISLSYKDGGDCKNQEQMILQNNCASIKVIIKDDANHIYDETLKTGVFTKNFSCIWNDAGDSLYIRDSNGLILFYRY